MTFDEQTYQQIHDYIQGLMDESTQKQFEERMAGDPELAEEVKINKELWSHFGEENPEDLEAHSAGRKAAYSRFLQSEEAEGFRNSILQAENNYFTRKRTNTLRYLAAACIFIAVLSAALFFIFQSEDSLNYQQYYTWAELPSMTERSAETKALARAEQLFREQEYTQALEILDTVSLTSTEPYLYKALALFETGQSDQALQTLNQLLQSNLLDRSKAHWYKALIYLKENNHPAAVHELETLLADNKRFFDGEARQILGDLEK